MKEIKNVNSPFMCYCQKVIPLAFDESMSYYEMLCHFYSYLKDTVMPALNNNAEALEEVQKAIIELKNYVDTYFDNLDVQEEINAKLDEMVESGEMAEIIAEYLSLTTIFAYPTLDDLKQAENLTEGALIQTYGRLAINDGGGAKYYVRAVTTSDTIDDMFIIGLADDRYIAQYIVENNEINIKQMGCHGTYEDHSFDNSEIMQTLIDYAESKGVILVIPNGFYGFEETLYINNNITIKGIGTNRLWSGNANGPILYFSEVNRPLFHISKLATLYSWNTAVSNLVENVHLSGFTIDGSNTGITGIYASCYLSSFKDIIITGFLNDISFVSCYELDVVNCQFMQSRQNMIVYDCNTTSLFKNVYINGGNHTASGVITNTVYLEKYTIPHMYNFCGLYTKIGKPYFDNLAIENSCYAIISRDSSLYVDKCNVETISDYCFDVSVDLNPNCKVSIDHANFYNPSELSTAKIENVHYRSRLNLKTINPLPLLNLGYGTVGSRAIDRIYSYVSGERIINLTLSNNVVSPNTINKSHYTEDGFKIDFSIYGATSWSDSVVTSISGLPQSNAWSGDSNYVFFTNPTNANATSFGIRMNPSGILVGSSGSWLGNSSVTNARINIQYEYIIN